MPDEAHTNIFEWYSRPTGQESLQLQVPYRLEPPAGSYWNWRGKMGGYEAILWNAFENGKLAMADSSFPGVTDKAALVRNAIAGGVTIARHSAGLELPAGTSPALVQRLKKYLTSMGIPSEAPAFPPAPPAAPQPVPITPAHPPGQSPGLQVGFAPMAPAPPSQAYAPVSVDEPAGAHVPYAGTLADDCFRLWGEWSTFIKSDPLSLKNTEGSKKLRTSPNAAYEHAPLRALWARDDLWTGRKKPFAIVPGSDNYFCPIEWAEAGLPPAVGAVVCVHGGTKEERTSHLNAGGWDLVGARFVQRTKPTAEFTKLLSYFTSSPELPESSGLPAAGAVPMAPATAQAAEATASSSSRAPILSLQQSTQRHYESLRSEKVGLFQPGVVLLTTFQGNITAPINPFRAMPSCDTVAEMRTLLKWDGEHFPKLKTQERAWHL